MSPCHGSNSSSAAAGLVVALIAGICACSPSSAREIEFLSERRLTTGVCVIYRCPHEGNAGGEDRLTHHRLPVRAGTTTQAGLEALERLVRGGGGSLTVLDASRSSHVPFAVHHEKVSPTIGLLWTSESGSVLEIVEVTIDAVLAQDEHLYERHARDWLAALRKFAGGSSSG